MKNDNSNIVKDLIPLLHLYLPKSEAQEFINLLENPDDIDFSQKEISGIDKLQVDFEVSKGKDLRILVDRVMTFSERMLSEDKFFELLLDLSKMLINKGELNFAFEIAKDLMSKIDDNPVHKQIQAETELTISKIYWSQAQWEECEYHLEEAYKLFKMISSQAGYAKCENMYGTLHGEKGELSKAREHFEKALTYLNNGEDVNVQAGILTNLGIIYTITGDYEKAIWNHKNSIEKFEKLNDLNNISRVYHNIGMLYTRMKKYDEALEEFNKCITISLEIDNLSNCAIAYIGKAYIYNKLDNLQLSDAFTNKAMEIACKINDTLSIADIYKIKGMINSDLENFELSEELFENSIRLNEDFENKLNIAESSAEIGKLLEKLEREEQANIFVDNALDYFRNINSDRHISGLAELPI